MPRPKKRARSSPKSNLPIDVDAADDDDTAIVCTSGYQQQETSTTVIIVLVAVVFGPSTPYSSSSVPRSLGRGVRKHTERVKMGSEKNFETPTTFQRALLAFIYFFNR